MVETVCLKLSKIKDDYVYYLFGPEFSALDGELKASIHDVFDFEIVKQSVLGNEGAGKALSKIDIAIEKQIFPEVMCYQC